MAQLILTGGRLIDPANGIDQVTDLVLDNGKVASIGSVSKPDGPTIDTNDSASMERSSERRTGRGLPPLL